MVDITMVGIGVTDVTITKVANTVADVTTEEGIVIITEEITIEDTEITEKITEKIVEITEKITEKIAEIQEKIPEKIVEILEKILEITEIEDKSSLSFHISRYGMFVWFHLS
ncbi:MAG: hypothetical protein RBQ76_05955 [Sulfurovum sp.]|jgi:hypothetical protein|nr:hypothetical protein [Sulfurovum sp.]